MTRYEPTPGFLYSAGQRFCCPNCLDDEFKVEVDTNPVRYWCDCGRYYTEKIVEELTREAAGDGE